VPPILARLDLLDDEGKHLAVLDFKTSRGRWSSDQLREQTGQLHLYHELVRPVAHGRPIRMEFAVLTKTRGPELVRHHVPAYRQSIERTRHVVARAWDAMQTSIVYPNPLAAAVLDMSVSPSLRRVERVSMASRLGAVSAGSGGSRLFFSA
jgi:hypothetical protein